VTGPGWLGLAQPTWAELGPEKKNKKNKNLCMHKLKNINMNLFVLVYSLTPESGIKILI